MTITQILKDAQGVKTQETFAKELGISRAMLSYLQNGKRQPGLETIKAMLRHPATKEPTLAYLCGDGSEEPQERR